MASAEVPKLGVWAEQAVVGSMLIDPRCVGLVVSRMSESDFTMEINRRLFQVFRERFNQDQVLDLVPVCEEVSPGDTRLRDYVLQLMDTTPTAANVEAYIDETRRTTRLFRLRKLGTSLAAVLEEETAGQLLRDGQAILSGQAANSEADMDQATLDFYDDLEKSPQFLPWGFPLLDDNLDVSGGMFMVLGGRPSDGKTALALHMAFAQARHRKVGYFTLEDDRKTLFVRLKSAVSGIPLRNILRRQLTQRDYALLAASDDEIRSRRLKIIEAAGFTVQQIISRARYHKFDVIYIDYLQEIRPDAKGRPSRYEEVSDISRQLATEARVGKIPIVALAQLGRPPEKGLRSAPTMSALKESGQIEQDANVIMFVWRRDETSSRTKRYLTIAKNKLGMLGEWKLLFDAKIQRFYPELVAETAEESKKPHDDITPEPEYKQQTLYEIKGSEPLSWENLIGDPRT